MTAEVNGRRVRVLHVSDIHFGHSYVEAHVVAAETLAANAVSSGAPLDAIVVSGDLSQRARAEEFRSARELLDRFGRIAPVLVVPGNHDTEWWHAPFGIGNRARMHAAWREHIGTPIEPTLRLPGVSIIGLNSAAGMLPKALTWYPRDWRVKGGLSAAQLASAALRLAETPAGDLRVLVFHHNLVRGIISNRWGLARPHATIDAVVAMAPDVVCNGHDHEERAEIIARHGHTVLVSTANTLSRRTRGKRIASLNIIEADAREVALDVWHYDPAKSAFAVQRRVVASRADAAR